MSLFSWPLRLATQIQAGNALLVKLSATPGNTGRADELARLLEVDPLDCEFERTRLIFEDDNGL